MKEGKWSNENEDVRRKEDERRGQKEGRKERR